MVTFSVDTSEVRALSRRFAASAATAERRAATAVRKTARDIEADAKRLAPVDTGALKGSISATVTGLSAEVGPTVEYGVYQELGTSEMRAQPYLSPAFDRRVPSFVRALASIGRIG